MSAIRQDPLASIPRAIKEPEVLKYSPRIPETCREFFWESIYSAYQLHRPRGVQEIAEAQIVRLSEAAVKAKMMRGSAATREESDSWVFAIAALLLLRDLTQMGWIMSLGGPTTVYLTRTTLDNDIASAKRQIKASMNYERLESLNPPSVKAFVRYMERPRPIDGTDRSIFALMGDGQRLRDLAVQAATLPREERAALLMEGIKPYLELVEGETRDPYTRFHHIDIWRYFRLTWSTPYRANPGRNMFYLVRDAAQIGHPVMGIAALSNVVIGMRCRDDRIGWTPDAIAARLVDAESKAKEKDDPSIYSKTAWEIADLLQKHLDTGLAAIDIDGITTRNEMTYPTEEGIAAIDILAQDAAQERNDLLRRESINLFEGDDWLQHPDAPEAQPIARELRESSAALFRRKRSSKLAALLRAKLMFQQRNVFENPTEGLPRILWNDRARKFESDAGRSALRTILLARKDTVIGSAMMEITVCGAVAPYSYLLGGKLVAMLLTSPQVVTEYRARYGAQASTIASQVAGREVRRDANLVFLGTSSLYAGHLDASIYEEAKWENGKPKPVRFVSASQYNRIKIPAEKVGGHGAIEYSCLGVTNGYGVVHFASDTREALEELDIIDQQGARRVNSLFGEGTSPRLRKIRQGITHLGLDDRFLVHDQRRLVYGINLAHNTERYLMGQDEAPNFIFSSDNPRAASARIAEHWVERWLSGRVEHTETLEKLAAFIPRNHAVSRDYGDEFLAPADNLGL